MPTAPSASLSRVAGIPAWTTKQGNHNWVEIWTTADKQWHFTEYYPDKKRPRSFLVHRRRPARQSPQPLSQHLRHILETTGQHFPMVWDFKSKLVPGVNVTKRYLKPGTDADKATCELRIDFTSSEGTRLPIPVKVMQGDVLIEEGQTPKRQAT